jgi:hypothetical protein
MKQRRVVQQDGKRSDSGPDWVTDCNTGTCECIVYIDREGKEEYCGNKAEVELHWDYIDETLKFCMSCFELNLKFQKLKLGDTQ